MATAQRWSRKRRWAAAFQGAEVVGEHYAANRGGVAIAGPQHINSSVPTEFEGMLGEAAVLAPEGLEHPLKYLQSRILARHFHAMLKRGVTLVTVYLEPGLRASGLNLFLLEVLAACILCFDAPGSPWGDWNMEPKDLAQAGWLDTVNGKVAVTSAATCAGGAGAVLDYFVLSEAMAHLVQQVKVVDNSPTTPHSHVCLTLKATSWGHRVLARRRPKPFPTQVPVGPRRQEEQFEWTWAAEEKPADLELAWLEWLRAAEAAWCRIHDLCGTQRRPFLGRSKGLVIEHVSLGQATRNDTRRRCSKKGRSLARPATLGGAGGWQRGRLEEGASFAGYVATVSQLARFHLGTRSWPLGPRLGLSVTRSCGTNSPQSCNLWGLGLPSHKGYGFRQASHTASSQRCGSGFGTLLEAMGERSLPGMGQPLPRPSLEEVDNVCKTYKHTAGLGHDCVNPMAILQLPVDLRVRFIDLLMAFEAKLIKPLSCSHIMVLRPKPPGGHRTIGLTVVVAAPKATGAEAAKAKRATEPPGLTPSWWRQQRGGSSLQLPCYSIWQSSSSTLGTTTSGKKVRKPGFQRDSWLVGALHTNAGVFSRPTNAPLFRSGPSGPFFQAAVGPQPLPNSCWQRSWKQWLHASRPAGFGMWSTTFRGTWRELPRWCKSSLPKRAGFWWEASRQLEVLGIDECDSARNVEADLQLGRRRRALVVKRRLGEGIKAHEAGQAATQGRSTHWQAHPHWLECRGDLGF